MLRKINEGGVVSDSGFSIQITGPEIMEYGVDGKVLRVGVNYAPSKRKIYVYVSDVKKWNTGSNDLIANDEKKKILGV